MKTLKAMTMQQLLIIGGFVVIFIFGFISQIWAKEDKRVIKSTPKNSIYVFSGRYTSNTIGDTADLFNADYENNYVLAAAYGRDIFKFGRDFSMGSEIGLASRFGGRWTGEIWGGMVFRHKGISIVELITVSPGLTFGASLVDNPIGTERDRVDGNGGNASFLFYLGPEIAFSSFSDPQWELVYRIHHRSGAYGTLGRLREGYNANTLGIRRRF